VTSTVHSRPVEGPAALSVLEGVGEFVEVDCVAVAVGVAVAVAVAVRVRVSVGERVVVLLVDVVVVEGDGEREVVVSVGVELVVAVGVADVELVIAPLVVIEDEVAVVPSVPAYPQPASTTIRTRASTESERRIGSTLISVSY